MHFKYVSNYKEKFYIFVGVLTFILTFLAIGISPVIGFIFCLILLLIGVGQIKIIRFIYSLGAIFSCSVIAASKNYSTYNLSDDFAANYWPAYQEIAYTNSFFSDVFARNYEYFFGAYLKILTDLNGSMFNQPQLMFVICFSVLIFFYFWLEFFGLKNIPTHKKSLCIAMSLGIFQFLITLQYVRQIFALIFILFTISLLLNKNYRLAFVFFVLACFSHLTSLIILPLYYLIMKPGKFVTINVIIFGVLFSIFFYGIVGVMSLLSFGEEFTYKFNYYLNVGDRFNSISGFKFLIPSLILARYFFIDNHKFSIWRSFQLNGAILFILLFLIPELPLRMFGLLILVLPGYLLFLSSYKLGNYFRLILIFYFIFYGYRLVVRDYIALSGTVGDFMGLWYSYPWIGDKLFYYANILF